MRGRHQRHARRPRGLKDSDKGNGDGSADAKETGTDRLARFASTLFEEDIPVEAVIGEDRLTVEEIITSSPKPNALPEMTTAAFADPVDMPMPMHEDYTASPSAASGAGTSCR